MLFYWTGLRSRIGTRVRLPWDALNLALRRNLRLSMRVFDYWAKLGKENRTNDLVPTNQNSLWRKTNHMLPKHKDLE